MRILLPLFILLSTCSAGPETLIAFAFARAAQPSPRNLTVTVLPTQDNTFRVTLTYQLPGNPDSAITTIRQQTSVIAMHRLGPVTRDSFSLPRPAAGTTFLATACVQSKRRVSADTSATVCRAFSFTSPSAPLPPPVIDTVRADTIVVTQPPPSAGVFYQNDFSVGLNGIAVWNQYPGGWAAPSIVNGALRIQWGPAADNNNRGAKLDFAAKQVVCVRIRYRINAPAQFGTRIMKLLRFRGPGDKAVGTLDIWGANLAWGGDDLDGGNQNYFLTNSNPSQFVGTWKYIEQCLDFASSPGNFRARSYIDGVLASDVTRPSGTYTGGIASVYLWGYFNNPADSRTEEIDEVVFSTAYVGVPAAPPSGEVLFTDAFVGGQRAGAQNGVRWTSTNAGSQDSIGVRPSAASQSGHALRFFFGGNVSLSDDAFAEQNGELPGTWKEVFFCLWYRIPANYHHRDDTGGPDNNKGLRVYGGLTSTANRDSAYQNSALKAGYSTNPYLTGQTFPSTGETSKLWPEYGMGEATTGNFGTGGRVAWWRPGTLERVGFYARAGTFTRAATPADSTSNALAGDGIMRIWRDGVKVYDRTNLAMFTAGAPNTFRYFYLLGWSNSGFNQNTVIDLERVEIGQVPTAHCTGA